MENHSYNLGHFNGSRRLTVPKRKSPLTDCGKRLAQLRKAAGYTQVELAAELGISQRMVAYYEGQTEHPPAALLPELAKVLNVSTDELLGVKPAKRVRQPDGRLLRRLQQIEKMGAKEKRQIVQLLDAFIEREQLKSQIAKTD